MVHPAALLGGERPGGGRSSGRGHRLLLHVIAGWPHPEPDALRGIDPGSDPGGPLRCRRSACAARRRDAGHRDVMGRRVAYGHPSGVRGAPARSCAAVVASMAPPQSVDRCNYRLIGCGTQLLGV
ncbi:hypothetical protein UO65_4407 [Actinokineospora spheciospongiae]|uniref:Uncharacterized protein n=1 Tax=Actinokineospora spheciospongiae TaxID=909613 RepID=W7J2E3_9PSEU|nr:hypothetical protein UO65_4407 [Actinokineospora spheciospongiae]